ncbi:hypothetical protein V8E51_019257 [Hyaloscypha variabilis]
MAYQSQLPAIRAMLQSLPSTREPTWTWESILSVHLPVMLAATRSQARFAGATNQDFFQYKAERQIWFHLWGQQPPAPPFPGIEPPMHLPVPRPPPPPPPVKSPEEQAEELYQAHRRYLATRYPGVDVDAMVNQVNQTFTRMAIGDDGPESSKSPPDNGTPPPDHNRGCSPPPNHDCTLSPTRQPSPTRGRASPPLIRPLVPYQISWANLSRANDEEKARLNQLKNPDKRDFANNQARKSHCTFSQAATSFFRPSWRPQFGYSLATGWPKWSVVVRSRNHYTSVSGKGKEYLEAINQRLAPVFKIGFLSFDQFTVVWIQYCDWKWVLHQWNTECLFALEELHQNFLVPWASCYDDQGDVWPISVAFTRYTDYFKEYNEPPPLILEIRTRWPPTSAPPPVTRTLVPADPTINTARAAPANQRRGPATPNPYQEFSDQHGGGGGGSGGGGGAAPSWD